MIDFLAVKEVFGDAADEHGFSIPAGPALLYFIRRFGYTDSGGDRDKEVCSYSLPTAVAGLSVVFRFGGGKCFIREVMSHELRWEYDVAEREPIAQWRSRCKKWGLQNGMLTDTMDAYLASLGTDIGQLSLDEYLDLHLTDEYISFEEMQYDKLEAAYKNVEPMPQYTSPVSEIGKRCQTAISDVLSDLLRPVRVRDVLINVLGVYDDTFESTGDFDEDERLIEQWERDVLVQPSIMAGHGVPVEFYEDTDLLWEFVEFVRDIGIGSAAAGMREIMKRLRALHELAKGGSS